MAPKLLTFKDIQEEYGLKRNTLAKLQMRNQFITAVKIGNRNYFEREQLEAWINDQKEPA